MSIKILGGLIKGQTLLVPKGDLIRPTSVMLRRKIFDARQDMSGFHFVDICGGSGAIALEALSRGAESATIVEKNSKVFGLLKDNCNKSKRSSDSLGEINLVKSCGLKWLESFLVSYSNYSAEEKESVIIFIDPPYEIHNIYEESIKLLKNANFSGEIWIESDEQKGIKKKVLEEMIDARKIYSQGTSFILLHG
ncbi:RsmD family RNA methyltransferase [Halobacteriovorax sp. HLS]|uniref:RsmD family RNA methyltransferase n=1 Tax=Halobacteriovorax sp. HLS TaxID=2234000 RepID=UPI000FD95E61|nr:RsmD family RNA methyltransferase [Halobacteriovorax sp. HLS]